MDSSLYRINMKRILDEKMFLVERQMVLMWSLETFLE